MGAVTASDDYVISASNCPATLGVGKSCAIQVKFAPDETGLIAGTLFIPDTDQSSPQQLPMSGTGK
jgi:hypothetical protein